MFIKNRSQTLITHCLWGLSWLRRFVMSHLPPSCLPLCSFHVPFSNDTPGLINTSIIHWLWFPLVLRSLCQSCCPQWVHPLTHVLFCLQSCQPTETFLLSLFLHPELIIMSSQCGNKGSLCGVSFNVSLRIISYQYLAAVSQMELSGISVRLVKWFHTVIFKNEFSMPVSLEWGRTKNDKNINIQKNISSGFQTVQ